MIRVIKIGVIVTLMVLILGAFSGVVAADYGDNLITDPNFTSLSSSSTTSWKYSVDGDVATYNIYSQSGGGAYISLTPTSGKYAYAYISSNSKVDLKYVSTISLTNTASSGTVAAIGAQYSTDGNSWTALSKSSGYLTGTISWDVSSLTGEYYLRYWVNVYGYSSYTSPLVTVFSAATATDISSEPVFSSASTLTSPINVGDSTSTTVNYTAGYPTNTRVTVNWGDGSSDTEDSGTKFTHNYTSVGYYEVTCTATNTAYTTASHSIGVVSVVPKITSVSVTGATLVDGVASITPGTTVYFAASYSGAISSGNAFTWYVGSNTGVAGTSQYSYTFSSNGNYDVKVKVTGSTGDSNVYTVGKFYVGTNSVSFNASSYSAGQIANVSWSLNNPAYSDNYKLYIYKSDSAGTPSGTAIATSSITSSSTTSYKWNTTGATGYYVAKIYKGTGTTSLVASSDVIVVYTAVTITSVSTTNAEFVDGSASVTPGTTVYFTCNYAGDVSSGNAFTWYVGGTESSGTSTYYQTFSTAGQYLIKVKATGPSGTTPYYTVGTLYVGTNTISFGTSSYTSGQTATISWSLNNPDYTQNYNMQIFQSDSTGVTSGSSVITAVQITSSSVTSYNWNTTGNSGYFVAKIYKGTTEVAKSSVTAVQALTSLTVTLSADSVTYKNSTTVTLYRNGAQAYQQTTTTGTTKFSNILTGSYSITAETVGYSSQSATITLDSTAASINIDFVSGASTNTASTGAGGMYSVTYVTFRVIDKNTGATVSGAHISGSAIEATNPIEWMVNWFGAAYGNSVIGTNISGYSDDNGVVSFVMYPNLRYSLTLTHTGLSQPSTRTFSPSSLSAEYPWYIEFPQTETGTTKNIKVSTNVSDTGLVSVQYNDLTKTTSTVNLNVYSKDDDGNYNISMGSTSGGGYVVNLSTQLTDYSGKDIKIVVTSQTTAYGEVTKVYYHTFVGPWLDLGLPNDVYIWICLLTAVLIGGVATFINSYAACFVICFVEWIYWFFGWFFQIGQMVVLPLLIFATVLSVLFYMQSRK